MVEPATRRAPAVPEAAWLKALPSAARFAFHGAAAARAAAQPVWGPAFSEEACRANAHATRATLWLGPDEYLLLDWASGGVPGADQPTPGSPEGTTQVWIRKKVLHTRNHLFIGPGQETGLPVNH